MFRLLATSSAGTTPGNDGKFVTAEPPGVTTSAASSIGSSSAVLNGRVDANRRPTTYFFEYGTTTSYGTKTSSSGAGSGTNEASVSKAVRGYGFRTATPPRPVGPRRPLHDRRRAGRRRPPRHPRPRRDLRAGREDVILGGRGNDVIYGGPGADTINGGAGTDTRDGPGNDTFKAREGRRDLVQGGRGNDLAVVDRKLHRLVSVERRR